MRTLLLLLLWASLCGIQCDATRHQATDTPLPKVRGLSCVAPSAPFTHDPMAEAQTYHADWIAVIPYAFTPRNAPAVRYDHSTHQWWGERPEGIRRTIQLAHAAGIKVMVKPQIWISGGHWVGELAYNTEAEWLAWEADFRAYLLQIASIAEAENADMFCIGTELKHHHAIRPSFWHDLIPDIRAVYSGPLTYAANWDNFQNITFWEKLDYIGINAYFPLSEATTPTVAELQRAWQPIRRKLRRLHARTQRPILFTEWGYLSVDGAAARTWELEANISSLSANGAAQAQAAEGLLSTFWDEPWWAGGFYWKWYPEHRHKHLQHAKDYSPKGKPITEVLQRWYGRPHSAH